MADPANLAAVLAYAGAWIGTPWMRRAARRGVGADCVGLVRGICAEVAEARIEPPAWRADWSLAPASPILTAARRHLIPVPLAEARPGHVLAFRFGRRGVAHVGVAMPGGGLVHAVEVAGVYHNTATPATWHAVSAWAVPCAPGCEPGPADLAPADLLAVLAPSPLGHVVTLQDGRDGAPLSRSLPYATPEAALAAVPSAVAHVERVD